jgi:death on curing protein
MVGKFVLEMENIAVWLAEGKISKELLGELIKSLIFEEEFSKGLKLKLAIAASKTIRNAWKNCSSHTPK